MSADRRLSESTLARFRKNCHPDGSFSVSVNVMSSAMVNERCNIPAEKTTSLSMVVDVGGWVEVWAIAFVVTGRIALLGVGVDGEGGEREVEEMDGVCGVVPRVAYAFCTICRAVSPCSQLHNASGMSWSATLRMGWMRVRNNSTSE